LRKNQIDVSLNELTGTSEIPEGIMTLSEMERFIDDENNNNIFNLPNLSRKRQIKDSELTAIDELLDNRIIDKLLAPIIGHPPCVFFFHPIYSGQSYSNR
jgi:hypothetical protein